jgi:hypothetical protein
MHHTNYGEPGYQRKLGNFTDRIREYLRNFAFMRRTRRFRAEVGKVTLKSNGDEALNDESP